MKFFAKDPNLKGKKYCFFLVGGGVGGCRGRGLE